MIAPSRTAAGLAGIVAGSLLLIELGLFLASGWSPEAFTRAESAAEVMRTGGSYLRGAALAGFFGLALTVLLMGGVARHLEHFAPTIAAATLYFALIGAAGHALVPLGLWLTVPLLGNLGPLPWPQGAWEGFNQAMGAAHGVGSVFSGLAMIAAGGGLIRVPLASRWPGVLGLGAGFTTLAALLSIGTPASAIGAMLFLPSIGATILFRGVSGAELMRGVDSSAA